MTAHDKDVMEYLQLSVLYGSDISTLLFRKVSAVKHYVKQSNVMLKNTVHIRNHEPVVPQQPIFWTNLYFFHADINQIAIACSKYSTYGSF